VPRAIIYCIVPDDLADKLHEPLRKHFAAEPGVEVIVEQRWRDRRQAEERRSMTEAAAVRPADEDQRRIRAQTGRRAADRRVSSIPVQRPAAQLPRVARPHAGRLMFAERLEPSTLQSEDIDTARLVSRIQAGAHEGFGTLYERYFDRIYGYLRVALSDEHEAEDATQHVFTRVLEALPGYERRAGRPFRAWLFTIARNHAITEVRRKNRVDLVDPEDANRRRELADPTDDTATPGLDWITDRELMLFVERLPAPQREVLVLRYMLDLTPKEIGVSLGRSAEDVRVLQHRALRFLEQRLRALGRPAQALEKRRWERRLRQAPVLRSRRYALSP
jgi:RNA polymerase sigma-70 factor (ECF subfamily)